jgi:metal-dependent amidase/aminoacylase/carboxypeptidase family protein
MLVDNGVMDGVEHIICTHCENAMETGKIGICYGDYMAACIPATIRFRGRTAHAALSEFGIDAVAMAVEAYGKMKTMVADEAGQTKYIWSVGRFQGGQVHNVVADLCEMDISFRFYDVAFAKRIEENVRSICNEIATRYGGSVEIVWNMSTGAVHNDKSIVVRFANAARNAGLNVQPMPQTT